MQTYTHRIVSCSECGISVPSSQNLTGPNVNRSMLLAQNFYYLKSVDNPDQRMAQDVSLFCSKLGQVAKVVATMPFGVVLYSYLTYTLTGSLAVLAAAYASFLGSVILLT